MADTYCDKRQAAFHFVLIGLTVIAAGPAQYRELGSTLALSGGLVGLAAGSSCKQRGCIDTAWRQCSLGLIRGADNILELLVTLNMVQYKFLPEQRASLDPAMRNMSGCTAWLSGA
jgi:hypothetical protein